MKPRRTPPVGLWILLLLLAFALGLAAWLEHDNHEVWLQHCTGRGDSREVCESLWDQGRVEP